MSPLKPIDIAGEGLSRVAFQFSAFSRFHQFLEALLTPLQDVQDTLFSVGERVLIDDAEGEFLDVIGLLVGQDRNVVFDQAFSYFGFADLQNSLGMGEESDLHTGGPFFNERDALDTSSTLSDADYRWVLKARIAANGSRCTGEDIIGALQFIVPKDLSGNPVPIILDEAAPMVLSVALGSLLSLNQRIVLRKLLLFLRPMGCMISWNSYYDISDVFGFEDTSFAKGFGEEGDPGTGGAFANQI